MQIFVILWYYCVGFERNGSFYPTDYYTSILEAFQLCLFQWRHLQNTLALQSLSFSSKYDSNLKRMLSE